MPPDVTTLLSAARLGDQAARDDLFALLYADLKRLARAQLRRGDRRHAMDTTALVHEAYLRLSPEGLAVESRAHLVNLLARVMRHVLIDDARERLAAKRGPGLQVSWPLAEPAASEAVGVVDLLALDVALTELAGESPRLARLVELRFFGGLELAEIGALEGVSERTVKRDWRKARAYLWAALGGGQEHGVGQ
jgi:RNA polymerase sigma factor (TIGR02999 family)